METANRFCTDGFWRSFNSGLGDPFVTPKIPPNSTKNREFSERYYILQFHVRVSVGRMQPTIDGRRHVEHTRRVDTTSLIARLLAFGIGFAIPLAFFTYAAGRGIGFSASKLGKGSAILQKIGGGTMIAAAFLFIFTSI